MRKKIYATTFSSPGNKIATLFAFLFFCLALNLELKAQCSNTSAFGSGNAPSAGGTTTLTTCAFAGEYSTINNVAAATPYTSTSSIATDFITIRQGTPGGPVVAFGTTPVAWTSTVAGTYYQHVNTSAACGSQSSCRTLAVTNNLPPPPPSGCTNTAPFGSVTAPGPGLSATITTCAFAGEYSTINGVAAGTSYTNTSSIGTDFLTIHQGTFNGPIIAFGTTPLTWTSTVAGTYFVHINTSSTCGTQNTCRTSTITNNTTGCNNTSAFGTITAPAPSMTTQITTCAFAGEYSTINSVTAATSYTSTSSIATDFITIRQGTPGGPVIAFGTTPLTWMSTVAGTYYQHVNTNPACGTQSTCRTTSLTNNTPTCTITCPANIVVGTDPGQCGAIVNYPAPTSTGTCGALTATPASGSFFPRGTTTVTVTSAMGGGVCTFTVTVNDTELPTISCPSNITVNNTPGQCGAIVNYPAPTFTDNCPGATVVSSPASGSVFPKGTTTVTSTVTDAGGNTATCTFTVTVNDVEPPVITCPANITTGTDPGVCGAVVNYALPAYSDNCALPGPQALSQTTSNSVGPVIQIGCQSGGFHTANSYWRAYDLSTLGFPGPLTVNTVTFGIETADANGTGTTQPVTVRLHTSAGPFPGSPRTLIATENIQVPDQTLSLFTVNLTAPPVVPNNAILVVEIFTPDGRAPANNRFFIGSNNQGQSAPCYISASDCGVASPVTLASLGFPNMHIVMNVGGVVAGPSPITQTAGLPSGSTFPVGTTTNTFVVTDAAGNTATCSFDVTVNDTEAPVITCPANITVTTPVGSCTATVNYTVTATDNCPGVTTALTGGLASGSAFPLGVNTVSWRATDASGNISNCSFTVTVLDGQLPVISAQPANRTVCSGASATFSVTATNVLTYQWQSFNGTTWNNIAGATASTYTVNNVNVGMNTNSYRVVLTGLCTVVTSNHASLYVNALPVVSITANPIPNLLPPQTTTLTATVSPGGGSYVWYKNGAPVPGSNSSSLSGLGVDDAGTYYVVYTDQNGCVSTSNSIEVLAQKGNLYVYPNPNRGIFQVRFFNSANEPATINVYDSKGSRVYQRAFTTTIPYSRLDVDLGSAIPSGVYIVEVVNGSGTRIGSSRIVIEK